MKQKRNLDKNTNFKMTELWNGNSRFYDQKDLEAKVPYYDSKHEICHCSRMFEMRSETE